MEHCEQKLREGIIPTEKELKLICMIRDLGFGEVKIYVADGQPVRVEEVRKSVKL